MAQQRGTDDSHKAKHLVVDAAGFLKNCPLQDMGEIMYTIPEIVDEILDANTRSRLQVLPYELIFKQPSQENLSFVIEFSKKTGDYPSLSATDLKVLALTLQLEKEIVGREHLRTEPLPKTVITKTKRNINDTAINGFFNPAKVISETNVVVGTKAPLKDEFQEQILEANVADEDEISDGDENDDDDNDSWITPQNIAEIFADMKIFKPINTAPAVVACLSTDFAVQNVLMHIGLSVMSVDGLLIKETKTYILRCYSCFKTTNIMTKIFCPHCGNKTMKRVATTVNADGKQEIHISSRRPIDIRGTKYSLPAPRGGKHADNPVLCEDQRIPHQRISNMARQKLNALDPDYVAGSSPFALNDVYSRAANKGIKQHQNNRRNPNEGHKRNTKRKK